MNVSSNELLRVKLQHSSFIVKTKWKMNNPTTTPYLKLPFNFNVEHLISNMSIINSEQWVSHFNTFGYNGEWKAISLYAHNGDARNILALDTMKTQVSETPCLKACPYFQTVINTFKFPILSARLLKLAAGAAIKPHRDHALGYEDGHFRLHIPIITNSQIYFILNGLRLVMQPGECWYTNVNYEHSVVNRSQEDRIHLVIDGQRNAWSDALFFSLASKESFINNPLLNDSLEILQLTLLELKQQNLGTEALLLDLEKRIAALSLKATT